MTQPPNFPSSSRFSESFCTIRVSPLQSRGGCPGGNQNEIADSFNAAGKADLATMNRFKSEGFKLVGKCKFLPHDSLQDSEVLSDATASGLPPADRKARMARLSNDMFEYMVEGSVADLPSSLSSLDSPPQAGTAAVTAAAAAGGSHTGGDRTFRCILLTRGTRSRRRPRGRSASMDPPPLGARDRRLQELRINRGPLRALVRVLARRNLHPGPVPHRDQPRRDSVREVELELPATYLDWTSKYDIIHDITLDQYFPNRRGDVGAYMGTGA
jgi:hypothetical protein